MSNEMNEGQGTPHKVLIDEIMSISLETGKTEREWAARREIEELRADNARLKLIAADAEDGAKALSEALREVARLEGELANEKIAYETLDTMYQALKKKRFATFSNEECWIYQGDGEDCLESLTCPVVIAPDELMRMKAELKHEQDSYLSLARMHQAAKRDWYAVKDERDRVKAELTSLKNDVSHVKGHVDILKENNRLLSEAVNTAEDVRDKVEGELAALREGVAKTASILEDAAGNDQYLAQAEGYEKVFGGNARFKQIIADRLRALVKGES